MSIQVCTARAIVPCLIYRDAKAAVEWLGRAFGIARLASRPVSPAEAVMARFLEEEDLAASEVSLPAVNGTSRGSRQARRPVNGAVIK